MIALIAAMTPDRVIEERDGSPGISRENKSGLKN